MKRVNIYMLMLGDVFQFLVLLRSNFGLANILNYIEILRIQIYESSDENLGMARKIL